MSNSVLSAPFYSVRSNSPRGIGSGSGNPPLHGGGSPSSSNGSRPPAASTSSVPPLRVAARLRDDDREQAVKLTRREIEVLTLVIEGNSSNEVADKLFVSKRTVDFHLANVYRKLSVKSRLQAYHEATRRGLLPSSALSSSNGSLSTARQ